jgi:hypothetical protein
MFMAPNKGAQVLEKADGLLSKATGGEGVGSKIAGMLKMAAIVLLGAWRFPLDLCADDPVHRLDGRQPGPGCTCHRG